MSIASMWDEKLRRMNQGSVAAIFGPCNVPVPEADLRALVDDALMLAQLQAALESNPLAKEAERLHRECSRLIEARDRHLSRVMTLTQRVADLGKELEAKTARVGELVSQEAYRDAKAVFEQTRERAARIVEETPFAEGTHTGTRQLDTKRRAAAAIRAMELA